MTSTETLIRALADRAELADLVARHSLWIDEGRYGETDRLFTEDVVVKSPRGEACGIGALIELVRSGHDTYVRTLHSKSNLIIEVDGETATVRAHDIAVFVIDDKTEALAACGGASRPDGSPPSIILARPCGGRCLFSRSCRSQDMDGLRHPHGF